MTDLDANAGQHSETSGRPDRVGPEGPEELEFAGDMS
jgi:hypothetical protein